MWKTVQINVNERAIAFKHGVPVRFLGPGQHRLWGRHTSVTRLDAAKLLVDLSAAVRRILPADVHETVTLGPRQRGLLYRDGKPVAFLAPGTHRYWTLDEGVTLRVFSVDEEVPELTEAELGAIGNGELCVATVLQNQRGLLYVGGRFVKLLEAGRYAMWSTVNAKVIIQVIDMRLQQATIAGQELMTRDKVTLRLTLTAEYSPADVAKVVHAVADVEAAVYLIVQLAARDYVAGVTLDELLEGRDAMAKYLADNTAVRARELGVAIHRVGIKDIVLPGEMKALLNRVIEAEKQAAANVILRREEVAATRTMANAAKVMAENPVLLKLKQLEAWKEIAGGIHEMRVFVGEGGLEALTAEGHAKTAK